MIDRRGVEHHRLCVSYHQDIATGPAIVLTATALFVFVFAKQQIGGAIRQAFPGCAQKPVRR